MDKRNLDCYALLLSNRDTLKEGYSLNHLLDQLNALDFRKISFPDNSKQMTYILTQCLCAVEPQETALVAKVCQLLRVVAATPSVPLEPSLLSLAVPWCVQALQRCGDIALLDILQALETILRTSGDKLPAQVVGDMVEALGQELEGGASLTAPADVRVWRVHCLAAASRAVPTAHRTMYMDTLHALLTRSPQLYSEADAQVVKCVLEALEVVCGADSVWLTGVSGAGSLGDVLGAVMAYLHYGLEGWQPQAPARLLPLPGAQWEPPPAPVTPTNKVGGKAKRRQKKRVVRDEDEGEEVVGVSGGLVPPPPVAPWLTSDSDMSDSEGGRLRRVKTSHTRVRVAAINLLVTVTKSVDVREMFGYYGSVAGAGGLCHSLLRETSPRLSGAAASTLAYMLVVAKPYFAHAQHSSVTSFTPFSAVLSSLLDTLHGALAQVLSSVPALQCAACLVDVSPYHRLRPGLLRPLLHAAVPLLTHTEVVVSVAALTLVGAVVSVESCSPDVLELLSTPSADRPWVLADALAYFKREEVRAVTVPMRVEWWQVVSGVLRHHWLTLARPLTQPLLDAILTDLAARLDLVRLHAARALQQLATAVATHTPEEADDCGQLWERALCPELAGLVGASPTLAGATCDCLAVMSPAAFQYLSDKQQIGCVTTLLGCARDEEAAVRTAAVQALAAFVTFPTLSQDDQFMGDCSDAVCALLRDPVPLVSAKAAWALGNITDVLYKAAHREEVVPPLTLITASVEAAQGKLKVRANGVRALGNLLGLLSAAHLRRPEYRAVPQRAATVLVTNATSTSNMKVSWNACYALGSMLRNTALHDASSTWQDEVLSALCSLVARSPNYKVRTTACGALAGVGEREHYGSHYLGVWRAALLGLQNLHDTADYREIRHQDGLLQQLCLTLCHLGGLVETSDLSPLHEELVYQLDTLQQHLARFVNSAVPERADAVLRTAGRLAFLRDRVGDSLTHTQRATLTMLTDIFTF